LLFAVMQSVRGETKGGRKAGRSHVWSAQTATRREREREKTLQVVGKRTNRATATTVAPCSCSNLHATKPCSVSAIL
jgi:hypothetical protein